jgi:hypothetical protein
MHLCCLVYLLRNELFVIISITINKTDHEWCFPGRVEVNRVGQECQDTQSQTDREAIAGPQDRRVREDILQSEGTE